MSDKVDAKRRNLLKLTATSVLALPLGGLLANRTAVAESLPRLSEDDAVAKSLSYVHDASASQHQSFKEGRACKNCNLIQGATGEWRGCSIFPGKAVNENGWCAAWVGMS